MIEGKLFAPQNSPVSGSEQLWIAEKIPLPPIILEEWRTEEMVGDRRRQIFNVQKGKKADLQNLR